LSAAAITTSVMPPENVDPASALKLRVAFVDPAGRIGEPATLDGLAAFLLDDNAFVRLSDVERSQELADSFERVDWIHVLGRHALRVMPCESILCSGRGKSSTQCSTTGLRPSPSTRPTSSSRAGNSFVS